MRPIEKLDDSLLFKRIDDAPLKAIVEKAATGSAALLSRVVEHMPLFTLHDERHVLNVIGWMERLLEPNKIIDNLSQLECALCILAAYTHDLGMTLSADEAAALDTDPDYLRHRDKFLEERALIERLRKNGEHGRAALIEGHIRTDFLRVTHADKPAKRLRRRIEEVAPDLSYDGIEFRHELELIAVSHNWGADWLRREFEKDRRDWRIPGDDGANFAFVGLLLRLADILDFDASRTPRILFRHIGLDAELTSKFEEISAKEWNKHIAISRAAPSKDGKRIVYVARNCPHPAIEKSIREFVTMIDNERKEVDSELTQVVEAVVDDRERLRLRLPTSIEPDVTPKKGKGKDCYTYHDWSFRLDQQEVFQLLMGTSLYGDPSLCIRELLQNALDALELRDLRLQLKDKGVNPEQPTDGESLSPGRFKYQGCEEELEVKLSWGEENGQQFIRVEDNGAGMTIQTVERYFTRIGKSFYRSPELNSEKAELRRHGLLLTPISTFGIGVLSCFMIAERLQVRTRAGGGDKPLDLEVSGPGSLFWTKPGTLDRQGTEITLWLRQEHKLKLEHDREDCFERLRDRSPWRKWHTDPSTQLDPGFQAAKYIVWPKYPVHVSPPLGESWTINERFHFDVCSPINGQVVHKALDRWNIPPDAARELSWELSEWIDDVGPDATGSRIMVGYVSVPDNGLPNWQIRTAVSRQIRKDQPLLLVNGVRIPKTGAVNSVIPCDAGPGCRILVDLRGTAAPSISTNRQEAFRPSEPMNWPILVDLVYSRIISQVDDEGMARNLLWNDWCPYLHSKLCQVLKPGPSESGLHVGSSMEDHNWHILAEAFSAQVTSYNMARDFQLDGAQDRLHKRVELRASRLEDDLGDTLTLDRELASSLVSAVDNRLATELEEAKGGMEFGSLMLSNLLQEAFFPDLSRSWPVLGLQAWEGRIGDAVLTAPARFRFEAAGRQVAFADQAGSMPPELARYGFDLCFPMTAIPLGALRRDLAKWREDRRYRPLGALPFLDPTLKDIWQEHTETLLRLFAPIREVHAFLPAEPLWTKPFTDWAPEDWDHPEHQSLLWDIATGVVYRKPGVHPRTAMR